MTDRVLLFFELHQPIRLKRLSSFSPTNLPRRFAETIDHDANRRILARVVERAYRTATRILLEVTKEVPDFKFTMSIAGVLLKDLKELHPDVVELLATAASKEVLEPAAQTFYHSLAWLVDKEEFSEQVKAQAELVEELLGVKPKAAENTEFIYNNDIGCSLQGLGFNVVLTEGVDRVLGWRSPNYVYQNPLCGVRLLLRNYRLSDDIGFRFGDKAWDQYPLTADKYAEWVKATPGDLVLIALDYETFGEHHWPESGIYEFLRWLPKELSRRGIEFLSASDALLLTPKGLYDVPPWDTISWADQRDLSAWLGNQMQREAFNVLRRYYYFARALGGEVLEEWRVLSISDHLYYMATKYGPEGAVHAYFSHLGSPYEAFLTYSYALYLLGLKIREGFEKEPCKLVEVRLPEDLCFHDSSGSKTCCLRELPKTLERLPRESDQRLWLEVWLRDVFGIGLERALELLSACRD
ncbi:MAG: alpha-amylase [Acidilobus sp.]|jgi:alpha-amylase|nr:alpha-amylase [Acidilobus sp.]